MEIISVIPRGYCQGVVRAIAIAKETVLNNPNTKVSMLGMIVHNQYVVKALEELGIHFIEESGKTRLELLDQINDGIVIFTAHGISDEVKEKAYEKGLTVVDATCKDVIKTHQLVKEHCATGGDVLYIGKKGHPESEGTVSLNDRVHLITSSRDVANFPHLNHVLITTQTTLSVLDTKDIVAECLKYYPDAIVATEICNATRIRQEGVMKLKDIDLLIVVGDKRSNNSAQLREIGRKSGVKEAVLIDSIEDLTEDMIKNQNRVAVTSGSSTPNELTSQVITYLKQYAIDGIWNLPKAANLNL